MPPAVSFNISKWYKQMLMTIYEKKHKRQAILFKLNENCSIEEIN
jgi:hypothetical protein